MLSSGRLAEWRASWNRLTSASQERGERRSALLFGVYHLTPLDGLYLIFWRFPVSQLLGSIFAGLLLGYVYARHGYETVVLGHALSNWLPMMLLRR